MQEYTRGILSLKKVFFFFFFDKSPEEGIILSIKWDIKARVQFCSKVKLSVQNKVLCANWGISQSGLKK